MTVRSCTGAVTSGGGGGSLSVTVPSIVSGDILVAFQCADSNITITTPVNASYTWVKVTGSDANNTSADLVVGNLWICAAPAGGSSVVFTHGGGSGGEDKGLVVYVITGYSSTVDASGTPTVGTGTATNYTAPSASPSGSTDLLLDFWILDSGNGDCTVTSPLTQDYVGHNFFVAPAAGSQVLSASGATGTRTATQVDSAAPYVAWSLTLQSTGGTDATVVLGPSHADVTIHP
jgi:hypothetical protein